jgi:predicted nucleic acid-binding protein
MRPLVLDTNTLSDTTFLHALREHHVLKLVPAVAYADASVHILNRDGSSRTFDHLLEEAGVEVERFERGHARTAAWSGSVMRDFTENARDHMISAHAASPPRVLVTRNVDDFDFLGDRVVTPQKARETFAF